MFAFMMIMNCLKVTFQHESMKLMLLSLEYFLMRFLFCFTCCTITLSFWPWSYLKQSTHTQYVMMYVPNSVNSLCFVTTLFVGLSVYIFLFHSCNWSLIMTTTVFVHPLCRRPADDDDHDDVSFLHSITWLFVTTLQ